MAYDTADTHEAAGINPVDSIDACDDGILGVSEYSAGRIVGRRTLGNQVGNSLARTVKVTLERLGGGFSDGCEIYAGHVDVLSLDVILVGKIGIGITGKFL